MAFGEPLSTRREVPGQALSSDNFGPCATAGTMFAATANARAMVAMDKVFISDLTQLMRTQVRAGRPAGADGRSTSIGSLPRHADRDRRATPFIPACATVNSVCEPQCWFDRLIRTAIANVIAGNCPMRFQTGGNGNVFQQATNLFLTWR